MMSIEEVREIIREEFDPECCAICGVELQDHVSMVDVLGIHWCAEHQFRGEFVNLMALYGWPEVDVYDEDEMRLSCLIAKDGRRTPMEVPHCSVEAGVQAIAQAALTYSDDDIARVGLKAMDEQESENIA